MATSSEKVFVKFETRKNKLATIRTTNSKMENGMRYLEITLYKNHKMADSFRIFEARGHTNLQLIIVDIEKLANKHEIGILQWPGGDKIFEYYNLSYFQQICNKTLKNLQIFITQGPKIIENPDERLKIMEEIHNDTMGGHCGHKKLYAKLRDNYYWQNA